MSTLAKSLPPTLVIRSLRAGYSRREVLQDVSLTVESGEIVAIIGHNGAGKSTLLKTAFSMIQPWEGTVSFWGEEAKRSPRELLRLGVGFVPQGNRVFGALTVKENLRLATTAVLDRTSAETAIDTALDRFPSLKPFLSCLAGDLSGGEKQLLALASSLALSPRLLFLDEPCLGLATSLVTKVLDRLVILQAESNLTIVIVEHKVREVLRVANRVVVLRRGSVSFSGSAEELEDEARLRDVYL